MIKLAYLKSLNHSLTLSGVFLACAAAAQSGAPFALTNHTLLPDGRGEIKVLTPSNTTYTLEWSSDLRNWNYAFNWDATNSSMTFQSPEPFTSMERIFLRARMGRGYYGSLDFMFFAEGGSFGGNFTPSVSYPRAIRSFSASFTIEGDTDYPLGTNVFFSSPPGFGLTNTPAHFYSLNPEDGYAWYQAPEMYGILPTGGVWRVTYKSTNLSYTLAHPQANARLVIPVPTVTVANDLISSVSWVYRNAGTGVQYSSAPPHLTQVEVQIEGISSGRLYNSDEVPPTTTQHSLTAPVYWSSVAGVFMGYDDTLGNHYVVFYQKQ